MRIKIARKLIRLAAYITDYAQRLANMPSDDRIHCFVPSHTRKTVININSLRHFLDKAGLEHIKVIEFVVDDNELYICAGLESLYRKQPTIH